MFLLVCEVLDFFVSVYPVPLALLPISYVMYLVASYRSVIIAVIACNLRYKLLYFSVSTLWLSLTPLSQLR